MRPGAFTLGDMGHVDENGFIFITDRLSDMVVSGGVNLYPSESENALRQHPGVADVAVIGIPHPDLGEQLLALVVAEDPASPPAPDDLQAFCRDLISAYKIPRKYEFLDELPRNEMQKVDKKSLRRPVLGRRPHHRRLTHGSPSTSNHPRATAHDRQERTHAEGDRRPHGHRHGGRRRHRVGDRASPPRRGRQCRRRRPRRRTGSTPSRPSSATACCPCAPT